jgi:hypothetical protein
MIMIRKIILFFRNNLIRFWTVGQSTVGGSDKIK